MFILCLIMLFFVGTHMLHFYKVFHTNGYHFFKCLWLSRNLSYPEHQFLCATSFPKEDTQMRDLWSSVKFIGLLEGIREVGRIHPKEQTGSRAALMGWRAAKQTARVSVGPRAVTRASKIHSLWARRSHWKTPPRPSWKPAGSGFLGGRIAMQEQSRVWGQWSRWVPGLLTAGSGGCLVSWALFSMCKWGQWLYPLRVTGLHGGFL